MGVSVGGVLRQWSAYFRRISMAWEMFGWPPVYGKTTPGTVIQGWLDTVVGLVHIGVVGTCDLAGGL